MLPLLLMAGTAAGSYFSGQSAAKTARAAAEQQAAAQEQAANKLANAGQTYNTNLQGISQAYNPYVQGGQKATNTLYDLYGLNGQGAAQNAFGNFQTSPGYQFRMDQGTQALDRSAAARGYLNSGRNIKDLERFGQGIGSGEYGNYLAGLQGLGNQGYSATGAQAGLQAQGEQGQLGAQQGASTIPQGMVAGANAQNQGITGALGALNYGYGQMQSQDILKQLLNSRQSSYGNQGIVGNTGPSLMGWGG